MKDKFKNLRKFFNNLTNEEKAIVFEGMAREANRLAMEIARQRRVTDYPDAGYFKTPEKVVVTRIEKPSEKTVVTKTELFFRNEDFEKQQKQIEKKRLKMRKEMEKHFKLSQIADYYEQDILDAYKESKICDEW